MGISPNRPTFRLGGLRTHVAAAAYLARHAAQAGTRPTLLVRIDDTNPSKAQTANIPVLLSQLTEVGKVPLPRMGRDSRPWLVAQSSRIPRYVQVLRQLRDQGLARTDVTGCAVLAVVGETLVSPDQSPAGAAIIRVTRGDGSPLWHMASSVDDLDYGIEVCVRGTDKRQAEPIQRAIITALGGTPPDYYYLPLVLPDGGTDSVSDLRTHGFRDATLFTYIAQALTGENDQPATFDALVAGVSLRSDLRSSIRLDTARLARLERQLPHRMTPDAMIADLTSFCARARDQETSDFATRFPVAELLAAYRRGLRQQYDLVAAIAAHRFDPLDIGVDQVGLDQAAEHLRASMSGSADVLTALGIPSGATLQIIRWMLCGSITGPAPQDLWDWHSTAGTLTSQIDHCKLALREQRR